MSIPPTPPVRPTVNDNSPSLLGRRLPSLAATAVVGVVFVAVLGLGVTRFGLLSGFDRGASQALNTLHSGGLGVITSGLYAVLSPIPAVIITAAISIVIVAITRRFRVALSFAVVVAVTWLPSAVLKLLIHRPRPDATALSHPFAHQPVDASFPSGHLVFVVAVVVAAVFLARPGAWRAFALTAGTIFTLIVAFALMVDGVHYPTDVFASMLWSVSVGPLVCALCARVILHRSQPVAAH
ncbi:phosphatase PAP2 family protein [Glaciihabitans sp. INWT7]|uniref:phosphatase PAP2 family protein n=1 Tax=Glaciihabitans sp. INWT7 TaxID=2596912 RepID=UPI0016272457|nr:phosphatase PAP2 family protein [Glaciihabitans sp. INWT7]